MAEQRQELTALRFNYGQVDLGVASDEVYSKLADHTARQRCDQPYVQMAFARRSGILCHANGLADAR